MNELMGNDDFVPEDLRNEEKLSKGRYELDELLKFPSFIEMVPGAS